MQTRSHQAVEYRTPDEPAFLSEVSTKNVTLIDEYFKNAETKDLDLLLSLEPLRFLAHTYTTAGLPRPAGSTPYDTLNGQETWERSTDNTFRGHLFGHWMSGLALGYNAIDDAVRKAKIHDDLTLAIEELKKCRDAWSVRYPDNAGWIGSFADRRLNGAGVGNGANGTTGGDGLTIGTGDAVSGIVFVPWYNLHKMLVGLMDIYKNIDGKTGDLALEIAKGFGDYFYNVRLSRYTQANRNQLLETEYGGMNDAFYELYRLTGDVRYKSCAEGFDEVALFNDLADGNNVLPGMHANTQIPKFLGAIKRYTTLTQNPEFYAALSQSEKAGLDMYLRASENFFDIVLKYHSYITGGNSQGEHFHAPNSLAATIHTNDTQETCNEHNMLKLARELFRVTNDKKYADYYENAFINAVIASQRPTDGRMMYFQPMGTGFNKLFGFERFWCCVGTGMESFAKLGDSVFFTNKEQVFVNLYFSTQLDYAERNLRLTQDSNLYNSKANSAISDTVKFTVDSIDGSAVIPNTELHFRVPDWTAGEPVLRVNGTIVAAPVMPFGYIILTNVSKGDIIELTFPMEVAFDALADNTNMVAFKYGPLVLSAQMGTWDMTSTKDNGILVLGAERATVANGRVDTITITDDAYSVATWKSNISDTLVRIEDAPDGQIRFQPRGTSVDDLTYVPYYRLYDQRYGIYLTIAE